MKKAAQGIAFITLFIVFYSFYLQAQENGAPPASEEINLLPPLEGTAVSPASPLFEKSPARSIEETGEIPPPVTGAPLPPAEGTLFPPAPPAKAEEHPVLVPAEGTVPFKPEKGYVGMSACRECHETSYQNWIATPHGQWKLSFGPEEKTSIAPTARIDCESCHGPGSLHTKNPEDKTAIVRFGKNASSSSLEQDNVCLRCHNKGTTLFWKASVHEDSVPCGECHRLMKRISERNLLARSREEEVCFSCHLPIKARMIRSPHTSENGGRGSCSRCHNPHGTATDKMLKAPSVNENCYRCHAEKRGPFLFEHFPVSENCLLCHDPHGSFQRNLLKVRQPYLCLDCHTNLPGSHDPFNPQNRFTFNKACINCHPQIHGSNHPSGARLQR